MKKVYFVSTGRCGTKRLAEILQKYLPEDEFSVQHQMDISRFANIAGNLMYYLGSWEWLKEKIHAHILNKYGKGRHFITTDPLVAMTIPRKYLKEDDTYIIHIVRDQEEFAKSFYRFSRKRTLSFIAHNFVPFWQIGIWPWENLLSNKIHHKYKLVWKIKNGWFQKFYNYTHYDRYRMNNILQSENLEDILNNIFDINLSIDSTELTIKSNYTNAGK